MTSLKRLAIFLACISVFCSLGRAQAPATSQPAVAHDAATTTPNAPVKTTTPASSSSVDTADDVERDFLQSPGLNLPRSAVNCIDPEDGSLTAASTVELIKLLLKDSASEPNHLAHDLIDPSKDEKAVEKAIRAATFIINVVKWNAPITAAGGTVTNTLNERWYVFHDGRLSTQKRLLGTKSFFFVYIHLSRPADYTARYDFTDTQAVPVSLQHLYTLASILTASETTKAASKTNVWDARQFTSRFGTSDIVVSSTVLPESDPQKPLIKDGVLDVPQTFHNEGTTWWDVGVSFPLTNTNQVTFDTANAGFLPKTVDKKSLFGILKFYPFPTQRKDIALTSFSWAPSVLVGLPLASRPLHKPLFGVGWGPPLLQFYGGALIVKQPTSPAGAGSPGTCTGWCPQFSFGISTGVNAIKDKLTKK